MLEPTQRDEIINQLRAVLVADLSAILKEEMRMFTPIGAAQADGVAIALVPGVGPLVMKEMRELEEERDKFKTMAHNVKEERDKLRIDVVQAESRAEELMRELAIYKTGIGIGDLKIRMQELLEKLP